MVPRTRSADGLGGVATEPIEDSRMTRLSRCDFPELHRHLRVVEEALQRVVRGFWGWRRALRRIRSSGR
jgi:hypothetical protein